MRSLILLTILNLSVCCASGQGDTSLRQVGIITGDIVSFTVDNLDNVYLLSSTNQLKKVDRNGDSVAVYNDVKNYGQATLIDVSNPLKVLLYYRDFATIIVLDRLLNVRNTIDLRKSGIMQAQAVGFSYDNKIWLFDEVENKLKKIDEDGTLLLETPDFRQLFDDAPVPQKIFDQDLHLYLYDSAQAVYVFDYYGTFRTKIQVQGWKNLRVGGSHIQGSMNNILFRYNLSTLRTEQWPLPETLSGATMFNFSQSRLYALHSGKIKVFEW